MDEESATWALAVYRPLLLFRVSEKIVTPTTVILMTMVTIPGFLFHVFVLTDFTPTVMGYWLAAVPVVAVGAPAGALICSQMKRHSIVILLLLLISLEFLSTLLLVPMSRPVLWTSLATLVVCGRIEWAMSRATCGKPMSRANLAAVSPEDFCWLSLLMDVPFYFVIVGLPCDNLRLPRGAQVVQGLMEDKLRDDKTELQPAAVTDAFGIALQRYLEMNCLTK